jgi:hypothetical protein
MNSESITKLLEPYENIESILFTTDYSDFGMHLLDIRDLHTNVKLS